MPASGPNVFLAEQLSLGTHLRDHRGLVEVSAQACSALQQHSPACHRILDVPLHLLERCGIDQRALLRDAGQAITHDQTAYPRAQLRHEDIVNSALHENAIRAHTGLPGVAKLRGHRAFHCPIHIRVIKGR